MFSACASDGWGSPGKQRPLPERERPDCQGVLISGGDKSESTGPMPRSDEIVTFYWDTGERPVLPENQYPFQEQLQSLSTSRRLAQAGSIGVREKNGQVASIPQGVFRFYAPISRHSENELKRSSVEQHPSNFAPHVDLSCRIPDRTRPVPFRLCRLCQQRAIIFRVRTSSPEIALTTVPGESDGDRRPRLSTRNVPKWSPAPFDEFRM